MKVRHSCLQKMNKVVLISEKPSIAEMIAKNLSGGQFDKHSGPGTPVYEFQHNFRGKQCRFLSGSVAGHVFNIDFDNEFNNWQVEHRRLFERGHTKYVPVSHSLLSHLKSLCSGASELILCLDNDREGENICFEVLSVVNNVIGSCKVSRARFSAVTAVEIRRALASLDKPNKSFSDAVEARQEVDLKIGVAFTRFQTVHFQGKFSDLNSSSISFGPCQTPTLGFCVQRHDEIQRFTPKPFTVLDCSVSIGGNAFPIKWNGKHSSKSEIADLIKRLKSGLGTLSVTGVKETKRVCQRPTPMNTVAMMKMASTSLGMSPLEAMNRAENLYTKGYLSYPRTESTAYPPSMDLVSIIEVLRSYSAFAVSSHAKMLIDKNAVVPSKKGVDCGDHPPITPIDVPPFEDPLFTMVAKHFLATLTCDSVYNVVTLSAASDDDPKETFSLQVRECIIPGWQSLYSRAETRETDQGDGFSSCDSDDEGPAFMSARAIRETKECGSKLALKDIRARDGMTKPPRHLTEAELVSLMEAHQIGTDASMAGHIENICRKNFVRLDVRGRKRCLVPTELGILLVHGYQMIDRDLVSPYLRARMEADFTRVANGQDTKDRLCNDMLSHFFAKFSSFAAQVHLMDELFEAKFTALRLSGKSFVRCGDCNLYMNYISKPPARLYCRNCDAIKSVPQGGKLIEISNKSCPVDGWPLIYQSAGSREKHITFTPKLFSDGVTKEGSSAAVLSAYREWITLYNKARRGADAKLAEDVEEVKAVTCSVCPNAKCDHSLVKRVVGLCPCCNGTDALGLLRDVHSKVNRNPSIHADHAPVKEKPIINIVSNKPVITINIMKSPGVPSKTPESVETRPAPQTCLKPQATEIAGGYLYLDCVNREFTQVCCNRCSYTVIFPPGCVTTIYDSICVGCGSKIVSLKRKTKQDESEACVDAQTGCILCEGSDLSHLVEIKAPQDRNVGRRTFNRSGGTSKNRGPHKDSKRRR